MATSVASQSPSQKPSVKNGSPAPRSADIFSVMRNEMDRVFERFTHAWPNMPPMGLPHLFDRIAGDVVLPTVDVKDTGKSVVIEVELPGVDEKDISLSVKDRMLTIKGEKRQSKEEKGENHYLMERSYGSFMRALQLPVGVDESKIEAHYDKGVLMITAEKSAGAVQPERRIEIRKA